MLSADVGNSGPGGVVIAIDGSAANPLTSLVDDESTPYLSALAIPTTSAVLGVFDNGRTFTLPLSGPGAIVSDGSYRAIVTSYPGNASLPSLMWCDDQSASGSGTALEIPSVCD